MQIVPPDLNSRRARFADWLELLALTNSAGQVSVSALKSELRRLTDDRTSPKDLDIDADDSGEHEVTDRAIDDLQERVVEELSFRAKTIGSSYPFELFVKGRLGESQILRRKPTWKEERTGELFYVFCLLDSGIRDDLIVVPRAERHFTQQIGNIFQICSCIAVGGYTEAEVVSFGFPRATGDAFLPALQAAWRRYGSYTVRLEVPHGFDTKLKDGGVDIIAWRPFEDGHAATFLMFVQVASGLDWKNKPVANDVKAIKHWFIDGVFEHFVPAICIPFPLWFDLDEPPQDATGKKLHFGDGIVRRFMVRESAFGIILDRGRIAQSTARALGTPGGPRPGIDGSDRIDEVKNWVNGVMASLAERRAVA